MRRCLFVLLFSLLAMNLPAADLPPAFKAVYVVRKGPFELGRSTRQLQYGSDGQLIFRSDSDTSGLADLLFSEHIRETTRLQQQGGHVLPEEYRYRQNGKRRREISQQFDWKQGQVTSRVNEQVYEFPIQPGTFDQSGYQVKLMMDLASGSREFSYHIAGSKKLRTYDIDNLGDERVKTVMGPLNTVVIQRKDEQTTTMWCAYDLHFLPVKIQHEENGNTFTAYLESVEGL